MSDAVHSIDAYTQRLDLQESIGWLIPHLPRQSLISVRGEADYYGAASEIARALGLKTTPLAAASWVHGWALVRPDNAVAITGSQPGNRVHLVDRTSTEDTLLRAGYPNAFAVGLPILYSKVPDLPRESVHCFWPLFIRCRRSHPTTNRSVTNRSSVSTQSLKGTNMTAFVLRFIQVVSPPDSGSILLKPTAFHGFSARGLTTKMPSGECVLYLPPLTAY